MPYTEVISTIDGLSVVNAVNETLRRIDVRLVDHGDRVAFIACELNRAGKLGLDEKLLYLLCVFHDIGAYKTDEIDRMVEFETDDVLSHSIYGYLFLKYLTPLSQPAEAILYHHTPWAEIERSGSEYGRYSALIHLADRIDIAVTLGTSEQLNAVCENKTGLFFAPYVRVFEQYRDELGLTARLTDGTYINSNKERVIKMHIGPGEALEYLKMIVYSIDFRSEFTVTHTINTVSIALYLADRLGLSPAERECIDLGALLHDVGKVSIPVEILEFPGRLSPEKMTVMRTHVNETEKLIAGIVPDDVLQIAVRHHEKLDGSGYPYGLRGENLDIPQRIVAVADIVSALSNRRSYKEPFPKEKTISILSEMSGVQLDAGICRIVCSEYDEIMEKTDAQRDSVIKKYQSLMSEYNRLRH